ncbi:MAG: peroxiredoxin-like family protein [Chloroflexota bacterium]|nr:peroxiredoxin-like family protein [Chloroflexota bacterium]
MTTLANLTSLQDQLDAFKAGRAAANPDLFALRQRETDNLIASGIAKQSFSIGESAPDFTLPNAQGGDLTLSVTLKKGPVVLTFYRGEWCPYCNLTLAAYQSMLPQIQHAGATLIAVSPQQPDFARSMIDKANLTFPVLSDLGNHVARRYRLVFTLPESLRQYSAVIPQSNGDESWELPMPATFVIQPDGAIRLAFIPPDYTQRLEPSAIMAALTQG